MEAVHNVKLNGTVSSMSRRETYLTTALQMFATHGFNGVSMDQLVAETGGSKATLYRYFPSKAAIVQAMCGYDLAEIQGEFAEIQTSDTPMTCLRERILNHFSEESLKDGQLWAEITAAAIRKPEIGAAARQMEMSYRRAWLLIDEVNGIFGNPVVETVTGGTGGGGAKITPLGEAVIAAFRDIENNATELVQTKLAKLLTQRGRGRREA